MVVKVGGPIRYQPTCGLNFIATPFYAAEDYHQDYLTLHPNEPYIMFNDLPKVDALKRMFPEQYRAEPVLVSTAIARK